MAASRDHGNNNINGYSSSSSDEDVNIGFPFEFLETADFQCIICTHVIRGFTELPCGHAGCKLCIEKWEKRKVACCECQTAYDKTKKHRSLYNDRKIKHEKQAHCKQHEKGCTWQGSINDYKQQHRKKCAFRNVRCRLCNQKVVRHETEGHKLTCTHRLVNCTTCGAQYRFINKKKHEDEECKVPCDYWQYGCHEKIHKPHMERHLANSARRHIELVKAHYDRIVTEKEKRLVMKNKAIAEKDKLLAERNCSLVEKEKSLAEKDKLLVEKDESLSEKNQLLAEKDKEIGILNTTIVLQSERITELEGNEKPMATGRSKPTEKQQVTKPKPLPRTGIQLYDSQEQVTPKPAQPTTAEWDGKKIHEIVFQGETLTFDVFPKEMSILMDDGTKGRFGFKGPKIPRFKGPNWDGSGKGDVDVDGPDFDGKVKGPDVDVSAGGDVKLPDADLDVDGKVKAPDADVDVNLPKGDIKGGIGFGFGDKGRKGSHSSSSSSDSDHDKKKKKKKKKKGKGGFGFGFHLPHFGGGAKGGR